jgi:2-dehydropantoate 2-reductase
MGVASRTRRNISSMYQDIKRKRRTEVDSINGAICAKAEELGAKAPLNRTMVRLIKALEEKILE